MTKVHQIPKQWRHKDAMIDFRQGKTYVIDIAVYALIALQLYREGKK